jgi:two-component system, cell cycle sensor histidine kinase and response regulator CckA
MGEKRIAASVPRGLLVVLASTLLAVAALGLWFHTSETRRSRAEAEAQIETVANLKAAQVAAWRAERLADSLSVADDPVILQEVVRYFAKPGPEAATPLLTRFRSLKRFDGYDDILLADGEGRVRLSLSGAASETHPTVRAALAQAFRTRRAVLADLHVGPSELSPLLEAIAPLFAGSDGSGQAIGSIWLQSRAQRSLYPLIQGWPTASLTAETLLVRRDGDAVLFLNELRHRSHTALVLRIPITQLDLPAVQGVTGRRGVVYGKDYRGVEVLGSVRAIPDSPWFIVAKMDAAEALADAHFRSLLIAGLLAAIVIATLVAFLAFWQRASKSQYQRLYEAERYRVESESRYRLLFEHMIEGFAHCRMILEGGEARDFVFLDVNQALEELTGLEDVVGRRVTEVIPGIRDSNPELFAAYGRVASGGEPEVLDTYVGALRIWLHISVYSPMAGHFVAIFDNITERRRAEEALRESEAELRAMFELASVGIAQADPATGRWVRVNQRLCDITGYSAEEMLQLQIPDITHPEDRQADSKAFERVVRGEAPAYRMEKRYLRKDGTETWVNVNMNVIRDAAGQPVRTMAIIEDINERKRATEELRRGEQRLHRFYDSGLLGVIYWNMNGKITDANDKFLEMVGYTREDLLHGRIDWTHMTPAEFQERDQESVAELVATGSNRRPFEKEYIRKDGNRVPILIAGAMLDERRLDGIAFVLDITDRKRGERALRASESFLNSVIDQSPYPMWISDDKGVLIRLNQACRDLLRLSDEEVVGKYSILEDSIVAEKGLLPLVKRVYEWGETARFEIDYDSSRLKGLPLAQSASVSLAVTVFPVRDGDGRITNAVIQHVDITERRRSDRALRESEARFSTVFNSSPLPVALARLADNRLVDVNDAWCRTTGIQRKEAVGRTPVELNTWADPRERDRLIEVLREQGAVQGFEFRLRPRVGLARYFLMSAERIEVADEACLLTMAVDISERKAAEDELRRQEERWRLAVEGAALGAWHWDIGSDALVWSDRCYDVFGLTRGTPVTHAAFLRMVHPEDAEQVDAAHRAALSGALYDAEFRVRWANGTMHWIASHGRVFPDEAGRPGRMEGVVRDITEQRRVEEQLVQAQKMEAIGQLAGGVAHDFNNVLGVVLGHCELAARTLHEGDPLLESVRAIHAAGERAAGLTRQLLAFSRQQPFQPQVVDLGRTIRGLAGMLRRLIGENIDLIVVESEDQVGHVKADPGQIEQVIINLAVNARDAMPDGGRLLFETANVELDEQYAREFLMVDPGPYVLLVVTDTGCGMTAETRGRVFEPFFTTKERGKGTGLGLATVYGIVKQSGGSILVESEPGNGTTFKVYLPGIDEPIRGGVETGKTMSHRGKGEQVLVVEDERGMREIVEDILSSLGYRPVVAADGDAALAAVEEGGLRPALLLTDVVMPGMSGPALANRLLLRLPKLKTIFMSGYTDQAELYRGKESSGKPFIQKPFSIDDLAETLWRTLARDDGDADPQH